MYFCIMVIVDDVSLICLSQKKFYLFKRSFKVQFICFLTLNNDNDKKKDIWLLDVFEYLCIKQVKVEE